MAKLSLIFPEEANTPNTRRKAAIQLHLAGKNVSRSRRIHRWVDSFGTTLGCIFFEALKSAFEMRVKFKFNYTWVEMILGICQSCLTLLLKNLTAKGDVSSGLRHL